VGPRRHPEPVFCTESWLDERPSISNIAPPGVYRELDGRSVSPAYTGFTLHNHTVSVRPVFEYLHTREIERDRESRESKSSVRMSCETPGYPALQKKYELLCVVMIRLQ